jgi:glycosyltransferase involved in cell wall biosynthesis
MKVLQVFNQYRSMFNGEEAVVERIGDLIERHGGEARLLMRTSRGIENSRIRRVQAAVSGIYSRSSYREMIRTLREDRPDIVHAHNLYPILSPSVLAACRREGVPVVMMLHNQQMTCPKADHLYRGQVCERCVGGKEHFCAIQNCRDNLLESVAYAARSAIARRTKVFEKNVTLFIALSEFAKRRLVAAGFDEDQIAVLHNMATIAPQQADASQGRYFAFAGRMSAEKGIDTILEAAALVPECPVQLAGDGPLLESLQSKAPPNVTFVGRLGAEEMARFYRESRCLLHSSTCFEMCPLVISEAMSHGIPVIASDIGGRHELVADGETGLLFEPGNARQLAEAMKTLWNDADRCVEMGRAGRWMATERFAEQVYYDQLIEIYQRAVGLVGNRLPDDRRSFQPLSEVSV